MCATIASAILLVIQSIPRILKETFSLLEGSYILEHVLLIFSCVTEGRTCYRETIFGEGLTVCVVFTETKEFVTDISVDDVN